MPTAQLFVYGSLKRGELHHEELRGAQFLGQACTVSGYALETLDIAGSRYWALVAEPGASGCVRGELYAVDAPLLRLLDEFEGPEYERRQVVLRGEPGPPRVPSAPEFPENRFALAYLKRTR